MKIFQKYFFPSLLIIFTGLTSVYAQGDGVIKFTNKAFKEVEVTNDQGEKEFKLVEPATVLPKDEIIYIITFENISNQPVSNINITDPIPNNSIYKRNSAFGAGTKIEFSIDGGKTYAAPENLKMKNSTGVEVSAEPENYTNIRWIYTDALQPGQEGTVTFRTIIE
ncbi:MAG: DUF11 domain-containing protein [Gammaproteobacteria bacterium]|nr:DUF11 domain-containing protein [Gammaproteobacteria bacterium]